MLQKSSTMPWMWQSLEIIESADNWAKYFLLPNLCMKHGESVDHLFLYCSLTMGLWHILFQLAKMDWVPSRSISDMLSINYNGSSLSKRGIMLCQAVSIALIWVVWRERNARIFEDKAKNSEYLWDSIYFLASLWAFCSKVFKGTPLNVLQLD